MIIRDVAMVETYFINFMYFYLVCQIDHGKSKTTHGFLQHRANRHVI